MIQIIPAIDVIEGKCVRLTQGDYSQKTIYNENPLEVARQFEDIGITRLHLVDLDGAKKGEVVNLKVLENIALKTNLIIDFGGGIKNDSTLENVFNAGATFVTIGSLAVKQPEVLFSWIKKYGADKIILGADVKGESITIGGWLETTNINVIDFMKINYVKGIENIFCTDISKDGLLQGPSIDLYKKIMTAIPELKLIASGGVSSMNDIYQLEKFGCSGIIVGKAIYENKITSNEIIEFNLCQSAKSAGNQPC
ncbi:MAG TPA: 1-(5-phosphoribosyl)-5-[(5-phosphoribosylamino)methylideneamino]imidazole-4-carboxamide isomerase [Bacteroidia bacterium]|jgi:phosphoribosylformimino-5-aminoimidazole carboxamide ribotide isomerase|nr:1-(5-phosphoribosyl)-5-[(5-phosphoribosylamino)methylideneamino]imidazole-4-carboxamide isomerase [Bacteroidia bacterium]